MCLPQPEPVCGYKMAVRHWWFMASRYLYSSKDIFTCQFDNKYSMVICWKIELCCLWVMVPVFVPLCNGFCVSVCAFSTWCVQHRSSLAAFSQNKSDLSVVLWFTVNCPCWSHIFFLHLAVFGEFLAFISTQTLPFSWLGVVATQKFCAFTRRDYI